MNLPPPLSWFYEAWLEFSRVLGMIMSWIILTILWIVGFGIYGVIRKIIRIFIKEPVRQTYWLDAAQDTDLHRQF